MKVLVVEDDRKVAGFIEQGLKEEGHVVDVAADGEEATMLYREALAKLSDEDRLAVVLRLEMGFTHDEVARGLGLPSAAAARMRVCRALVRMVEGSDGR